MTPNEPQTEPFCDVPGHPYVPTYLPTYLSTIANIIYNYYVQVRPLQHSIASQLPGADGSRGRARSALLFHTLTSGTYIVVDAIACKLDTPAAPRPTGRVRLLLLLLDDDSVLLLIFRMSSFLFLQFFLLFLGCNLILLPVIDGSNGMESIGSYYTTNTTTP